MKVFVTKYALTVGIEEKTVEDVGDGAMRDIGAGFTTYYHGEGRDWHLTIEGAKLRAEEMRTKKLASLRKSLAKLEALRF